MLYVWEREKYGERKKRNVSWRAMYMVFIWKNRIDNVGVCVVLHICQRRARDLIRVRHGIVKSISAPKSAKEKNTYTSEHNINNATKYIWNLSKCDVFFYACILHIQFFFWPPASPCIHLCPVISNMHVFLVPVQLLHVSLNFMLMPLIRSLNYRIIISNVRHLMAAEISLIFKNKRDSLNVLFSRGITLNNMMPFGRSSIWTMANLRPRVSECERLMWISKRKVFYELIL